MEDILKKQEEQTQAIIKLIVKEMSHKIELDIRKIILQCLIESKPTGQAFFLNYDKQVAINKNIIHAMNYYLEELETNKPKDIDDLENKLQQLYMSE